VTPVDREAYEAPLIPANAGTQIVRLSFARQFVDLAAGRAIYDLGPGIRRDERKE
jgi:hypothetical protein